MTTSIPVPPRRLVVGAVLADRLPRPTQVLGARRTAPPELAGQWELPGGKVEPGETPLAALHRELQEELGVTVSVGELLAGPLPVPEHPGLTAWPLGEEPSAYAMVVWWCTLEAGTPQPLQDHDELRWLTLDELVDVPWLPADLAILEVIEAGLEPLA